MNKTLSLPIKIAAFFFLIGGLFSLIVAIIKLAVYNPSVGPESLRNAINQLTQIVVIALAILNIFVGWFLIKVRRWSYTLGIVLAILTLGIHVFTLFQVWTTRWYGFALSVAILILLIAEENIFIRNLDMAFYLNFRRKNG